MTIFRCVDFETTGLPTADEKHAMVEAGWCDVSWDGAEAIVLEPQAMLVNPGRPIPVEAMAVHHIRDEDIVGAPSPDAACVRLGTGADAIVAHPIDFDRQFFGGGDRPWYCTHKSSLRVWPLAPGHGLQHLRYHLKFDDDPAFERELSFPPHRAGPDAYVLAFLFRALLKHAPLDKMLTWSSGPALLSRMTFGDKHRGEFWSDVAKTDPGYLQWIIDKFDPVKDRDARATARYYLKQRQQPGATP